jgi:DNA repair protein RadA/Sms
MSKLVSSIYTCSNCDAQFSKWSGRCLECGAWGTLIQETVSNKEKEERKLDIEPATVLSMADIETKNLSRINTNISEFDRVMGGGIASGSIILLAGEPGIGKSTILAQIARAVSEETKPKGNVIYVSGEESAAQFKDRLERLGSTAANLKLICETNVEKIIAAFKKAEPTLAIIDSIQTVYSAYLPSEAGSINQIRQAAMKFLEYAKKNNVAIILVGHITKDGQVAGPKSLEHLVDTVVYLESEKGQSYRLLRAVKNRFGSVNEIGIFEMTGAGLKEILNPGAIFIDEQEEKIPGSVISCIMEGTRPFLLELQALATKTIFGYPVRKTSGFDLNRLQVLAAVLSKRTQINLINQDIILNIVGGLRVNDPAIDLAACLAITSSLLNQSLDRQTLILGEVGLGGEVRNVSKLKERLAEAEKLGFTQAIIPNVDVKVNKLKIVKVKNVNEAVEYIKK